MTEKMSAVKAIKTYFETPPHARTVAMDELKALNAADRAELGKLCAAALGAELETK